MNSRIKNKKGRSFRLKRQKFKRLCENFGKPFKNVQDRFFEKKPHPLPKGMAKIERKLKGQLVLKRDEHHVVTLQRNFFDRAGGEIHTKMTPNRTILISKFFNPGDQPYKHLCFNGMTPFLNCKRYKVKPRQLA